MYRLVLEAFGKEYEVLRFKHRFLGITTLTGIVIQLREL